jgi:hypothetical protein
MAMNQCYLMHHEKQFVATPVPGWVAHMEWVEFELKEQPVPTVGSTEESSHAI